MLLPVNVGIVAIVAFIQTVDGFLLQTGDFLRRLGFDPVQSTSLGGNVLLECVPDIQSPTFEQVEIARVAGQTLSHSLLSIDGSQQYSTTLGFKYLQQVSILCV